MDATTRWETEALRDGAMPRPKPPKPSRKRTEPTRNWVTLKEAEAATGIPSNTLRKWVRKSSLPSYLESDGELAIRMVDLDAVIARANELGRDVAPVDVDPVPEALPHAPIPPNGPEATVADVAPPTAPDGAAPGTMIVPIDAWNKMLQQLGNLHDAGQQLAEARERAAKAETEAMFLRERLAELRSEPIPQPRPMADAVTLVPQAVGEIAVEAVDDLPMDDGSKPTTTYWRYLTSGWRARNRRDES
jgi:hypothetical protein